MSRNRSDCWGKRSGSFALVIYKERREQKHDK